MRNEARAFECRIDIGRLVLEAEELAVDDRQRMCLPVLLREMALGNDGHGGGVHAAREMRGDGAA